MVELHINYWNGDSYVGTFDSREQAEEYFKENKDKFRDYSGEKYGFPFGTPLYLNSSKN